MVRFAKRQKEDVRREGIVGRCGMGGERRGNGVLTAGGILAIFKKNHGCGICNHSREPMATGKCVRDCHTNGLTCSKIHHMAATMGALTSLCVPLAVLCPTLCSLLHHKLQLYQSFNLSSSILVTRTFGQYPASSTAACWYFTLPLRLGPLNPPQHTKFPS